MHRRNFLKTAGCLSIGFSIGSVPFGFMSPLQQQLPGSLRNHPQVDSWLEILAGGQVRIYTGKLELGQGIRTAIAQVAAEELELEMSRVEVVLADTGRTPNEGYTAGSGSIENSAMAVRYAAAFARKKLLELAAAKWNVAVDDLDTYNGIVKTRTAGRTISFSELLQGQQLQDEVRPPVTLKKKSAYRLVGKAVPRDDVGRMVRGEQVFVHDLHFPGMVHARIIRPPAYRADLQQLDEQAAMRKLPGILKVVRQGSFLGVIAADEYVAVKAQRVLREMAKWSGGAELPQGDLKQYLRSLPTHMEKVLENGAAQVGEGWITAQYAKPYIMHGSMGPSCAVALFHEGVLHIWTHSQGVFPLRNTLAQLLKMSDDNIRITGVPGAGCYGHNGADDAAADAALLALQYPGKHVRLQWSREEEHGWEPYGSAMIMELAAQLDAGGRIAGWKYDLWSDTHSTRPGGNPGNLLAAQYLPETGHRARGGYSAGAYRNAEPYYTLSNISIHAHFFKGPLRVSALRGLGAYANIFAIESFMDELAEKANKDPFAFRLMHLQDQRAIAVITRLQELVENEPAKSGTGIGIAFSRYKNSASYCAVAARVHVDRNTGQVQVQKMWSVIDAGETINPDGLKNQTEGGMIQSASWTLQEQVKFDKHHVTSVDWLSYPIFRFHQVPEVEVVVIDRPEEKVLGAGEAAQGPAAAALANAVYRACGKRVRDLPILPEKIRAV